MRTRSFLHLTAVLVGATLTPACYIRTFSDQMPLEEGCGGTMTGGGGEGGAGGETGEGGAGGDTGEGGAGGGTGGGGSSGDADICPGSAQTVALGGPLVISGSTVGLANNYYSYCGSGTVSGADAVYALTAADSGTLTVNLQSSGGLNGVIYAQQTCGGTSFVCADEGSGAESFKFAVQEGSVYYVMVDGRDATAGNYTLTASLQAGVCGDGVVNAPLEDCDLGDTSPGDGCDATCQFEEPADTSDTCPGQLYQVDAGTPLVIDSYTTGYTDNYGACGAGIGSPERVFAIFSPTSGDLTVSLPNLGPGGGGFDGILAAWQGSCDPSNTTTPPYLGCSDGPLGTETETMTFPVTAGVVTFVMVEGYASYSYGNFELTVELN